jgi:hypothetical protein
MPKITECYLFVACDTGPDDEGIAAFLAKSDMWLPMVAADKSRVDSLRGMAQRVANESGDVVRLIRFSVREELEVFEPRE